MTKTAGQAIVGAIVALLVIAGISVAVNQLNEDDQAFVDFEANWSSGRPMIATIEIGGEPELTVEFQRDDPPRLGIRRTAFRGQRVRMIVTPVDVPGTVTCSIHANEHLIDEDQVSGMGECFVEGTVP